MLIRSWIILLLVGSIGCQEQSSQKTSREKVRENSGIEKFGFDQPTSVPTPKATPVVPFDNENTRESTAEDNSLY